ncbi:MAG: PKD domain-containing protein [Anaerolineae bacterium]|nr:PKD domain-containing protein [Anaerolineae bacterium]
MKHTNWLIGILLVALFLPWSLAGAQNPANPSSEPIDDQTPALAAPVGKVDPSDTLRIPEDYFYATGGPDRFGYTYADSDAAACAYDWIETGGSPLALIGDDESLAIPIGFPFPFYGQTYTQLTVDSNGALLLADGPSAWANQPLGPDGSAPRLAPFWDDLIVEAVQVQVTGTAPHRALVVTYQARLVDGGSVHLHAQLREDGHVTFLYDSLTGERSNGEGATVGIQGPTAGLGYLFNGYPRQNRLHAGLAVCFTPPDGLYLSPGFQAESASAGQEATFLLWAVNQTGAPAAFELGIDSPWPATVTPRHLSLAAGQVQPATVAVRVPAGSPGERADIVVHLVGPEASTSARLQVVRTSGQYGYTGASTTDEAAVFDLQTATWVTNLSLLPEGNYPYDATVTPDGGEVWIPGASGDGVVVIDTTTNQIAQRVLVGEYPVSVAFRQDGAYAFVANRDTEDVTVVDTTSYTVVNTIPIPTHYLGAGNLALNPVSGAIYVVDWYGDYFWVLDSEAFTVTQEVQLGDSLWQLVVGPMGDRLYLTDRGLDVVHVLDTADLSVVTAVPVGDDPWGIDVTPDGTLIYVTNEDSHDVTVIDATGNSVITTVTLPHGADSEPRDIDFSADGRYAYVTSGSVTGDDEVYVLETDTHTVAARINVAPASNPNVVAVAPQVNLGLELLADKQADPEPVILGDLLTYTLSFTYTGLVSATNVLVTDTLPAGVEYLTSTGGLGSAYDPDHHRIVWDLGEVPAVATGTLTALVQPADWALAGQVITNEAKLDFTSFANFSATVQATSTVLAPELSIRYPAGDEPPDPLLLCDGDEVILAAVSNRPGPLTYTWDLGDGTLAATPVVTYSWTYGDYTLLLTTTNGYGWVETDTLRVQVGHQPVAGFLSNSPVTLGQNAILTDTTAFDPATWAWDLGDGVGTSSQPEVVYSYSNAGDYTVALTVTNRCGVDVYSALFRVQEPPPPLYYVYLPVVFRNYP